MKDPAFLFYPNDYIGGTMGMTFEEKGAYVDLLMMQFNRGHMTEHMIRHMIGQLWDKIKDKFTCDDKGLYYNERLDLEKERRQSFTKSRRNNKLGRNQHSKKDESNLGHMTSHMEDENRDENIDLDEKENINSNKEYDSFIREFHNEEWFESLCMDYKIPLDKLNLFVLEFETDRKNDKAYNEKSLIELRSWFINFIKKKGSGATSEIDAKSIENQVLTKLE